MITRRLLRIFEPSKVTGRGMETLPVLRSAPEYKGKPIVNMWLVPWEPQLPSHELSEPQLTHNDVKKAIEEYQQWFLNDDLPRIKTRPASPFAEQLALWQFPVEWMLYFSNHGKFVHRHHKYVVQERKEEEADMAQGFNPQRHGALGYDLAASHFIVNRGGRVRFEGKDNWIDKYDLLPNTLDKSLKVQELDASACNLSYYGLDNLFALRHLEHLDISSNEKLDDWAIDKISCFFRYNENFKTLNLANNSAITYRGVESLIRIPSLKLLIITGTPAAKCAHIDLLIHLFNEVNPSCKIIC